MAPCWLLGGCWRSSSVSPTEVYPPGVFFRLFQCIFSPILNNLDLLVVRRTIPRLCRSHSGALVHLGHHHYACYLLEALVT